MSTDKFGEVENIPYEMKRIEWRLHDFFSVTERQAVIKFQSPDFFIGDILWHIWLFPRHEDNMTMYFLTDMKRKYSLEYYLGFKKLDDSVELLASGILKKDEVCGNHTIHLIKKRNLLKRKSDLVPNDVLTLTCIMTLMTEISNSPERTVLDVAKPLTLIKLDKLSENLKNLFDDEESCDVILKVQDKEYKVHKSILMVRSSVFAANFKHDTLERQTGHITIPDCDPVSFQLFLKYLYCGKLEEISFSSALNLYYTSDKYDVTELKEFCIEYLKQNLTVDNMCDIAVFADKYDETDLISVVNDFFKKNACKIFETSEWECLLQKDYRLANKLLKEMVKKKSKE